MEQMNDIHVFQVARVMCVFLCCRTFAITGKAKGGEVERRQQRLTPEGPKTPLSQPFQVPQGPEQEKAESIKVT